MIQLKTPTKSQLESIEVEIRLTYAKVGKVPPEVRKAKDDKFKISAAWQNQALRYFYLCVRIGVDPLKEVEMLHFQQFMRQEKPFDLKDYE